MELDGQATNGAESLEHEPGANAGEAGRIDAYFAETYVAEDHLIGWATLAKGRHTLTFVCVGKNSAATGFNLGIDTFVLATLAPPDAADAIGERAEAIRAIADQSTAGPDGRARADAALRDPDAEVRAAAAWTLGQLKGSPRSIQALTTALGDPDAVVRGLAAIALRNAGTAAAPALEPLLRSLRDEEIGVRMIAAQALGHLRDPSAIDPLIAAAREPGQNVHVLRSVADALGEIGSAAERALPALREMQRIPRATWNATAAIKKIERQE